MYISHVHKLSRVSVCKFYLGKSGKVVGEEEHSETEKEGGHETLDDNHPIHKRMANPAIEDHSTHLNSQTYDAFVKSHDVVIQLKIFTCSNIDA